MGYYTDFHVEVYPEEFFDHVHKELCTVSGYDYINGENLKWYDCESDCDQISKAFSNCVIVLWGNGEEIDDRWVLVSQNGHHRVFHGETTFPGFQEHLNNLFGLVTGSNNATK